VQQNVHEQQQQQTCAQLQSNSPITTDGYWRIILTYEAQESKAEPEAA